MSLGLSDSRPEEMYRGVGGWLLFFIVVLVVIVPLLTLGGAVASYREARPYAETLPTLYFVTIADALISVTLAAFGAYAGLLLWKIAPKAVETTKLYLVVRLVYAVLVAAVTGLLVASTGEVPAESRGAVYGSLAISAVRTLVHVGVWYAYLNNSKRVQATYGHQADVAAPPPPPKFT